MTDTNYKFWGNGDKGDVHLSYDEYFEILDTIQDERLSPVGLMRFKNLHEVNSFGLLYMPIYCLPPAMLLTRFIVGKAQRGHSGYRPYWTILSLTWPLACWVGFTTPMPRKLYTDIVASQDEDGTYVRKAIKQQKPGLWRVLSKRLFEGNYMLPEMHENTTKTEFPTDFVNPHKW